ncbi:MAG: hypothetical protein AMXMBFR83_10700, partial [Phycisphaerae bacterium]
MSRAFASTLVVLALAAQAWADLAEYVARHDPTYAFKRVGDGKLPDGGTYIEVVMTSQTWRGITWRHRLTIVRPAGMDKPTHGLLFISGGEWPSGDEAKGLGRNNRELPTAVDLAARTKMPVAVLNQVPFQPIFGGKYEDAIISYTFQQYMQTGEEDWPLLMPMVKAAVRAELDPEPRLYR